MLDTLARVLSHTGKSLQLSLAMSGLWQVCAAAAVRVMSSVIHVGGDMRSKSCTVSEGHGVQQLPRNYGNGEDS